MPLLRTGKIIRRLLRSEPRLALDRAVSYPDRFWMNGKCATFSLPVGFIAVLLSSCRRRSFPVRHWSDFHEGRPPPGPALPSPDGSGCCSLRYDRTVDLLNDLTRPEAGRFQPSSSSFFFFCFLTHIYLPCLVAQRPSGRCKSASCTTSLMS